MYIVHWTIGDRRTTFGACVPSRNVYCIRKITAPAMYRLKYTVIKRGYGRLRQIRANRGSVSFGATTLMTARQSFSMSALE